LRRRTIFKAAAAAAAAAPAAALLGESPAQAYATYDVAVCEQYHNQVQIYPSSSAWSTSTLKWSFTPGTANGWSNLSDVKFRNTAAFGVVALVTASGGKVAIVNKTDEAAQELDDVLWSATPGNNPHAIERIPNIGAIVVASSGGYLYVYGPTAVSDPSTLALVQTISFDGAHGVWWDDITGKLWAIGQDYARIYTVSGDYRNTRLSLSRSISIGAHLGHSLDASYSNSNVLLATDGRQQGHDDRQDHVRRDADLRRQLRQVVLAAQFGRAVLGAGDRHDLSRGHPQLGQPLRPVLRRGRGEVVHAIPVVRGRVLQGSPVQRELPLTAIDRLRSGNPTADGLYRIVGFLSQWAYA
jgi:hypothetical protein